MVDVVGADAGQVGDQKAGVEGAQVDEGPGQDAQPVRQPDQARGKAQQAGVLHQLVHDGVQAVGLPLLPVLLDIVGDLLLYVEYVVPGGQPDLGHGVHVRAGLEHHHGGGDVVVLVDLLSHDEPVQGGEFLHRHQIGRQHQGQVADALPLPALGVHVGAHGRLGDVDGDHVHGVVALGEEIGDEMVHGVVLHDPGAVAAHKTGLLHGS